MYNVHVHDCIITYFKLHVHLYIYMYLNINTWKQEMEMYSYNCIASIQVKFINKELYVHYII